MRLADLIEGLDNLRIDAGDPQQVSVEAICYRAQDVRPGGLFVAIPGLKADGHDYIPQALANGAAALLVERPVTDSADAIVLKTANARKAMGQIAARFHGHPSEKMVVAGVTGTNGKTTITYLMEEMLRQQGVRVGVIGTVNWRYDGQLHDNAHTTPESPDLQRILARMHDDGVTHVILEVASHGLDLFRVEHCWFDVGVFTNLTQDHLDYHGDMQTYAAVKRRLFVDYMARGPKKDRATAVINMEDPFGRRLHAELSAAGFPAVISSGTQQTATVRICAPASDLSGTQAQLETGGRQTAFATELVGEHNLQNIASAVAAATAMGFAAEKVIHATARLHAVPGRLQPVADRRKRHVYVDYAHTPDALENVLCALRPLTSGRLICLFGCGGDRDQKKRPLMGAIAHRLADLVVVTSDNPRSEDPLAIIEQILAGLPDRTPEKDPAVIVEPDRRKAIQIAIGACRPADAVLIAGKGHETYQLIGDRVLEFDDRQVAAEVLADTHMDTLSSKASADSWTLKDILDATGGELAVEGRHKGFGGISIDSRTISPDQLFVAICGPRHDGHKFAAELAADGVRGLLVNADAVHHLPLAAFQKQAVTCIAVADTTRALGDLAAHHRKRMPAQVVAITGSNGKTTTRRMTAAVLAGNAPTLATKGNLNNEFGLPLTLFRLTEQHRWAVLELGMNHAGEIRRLAQICRPDIGVVTNIGPAHLAGFDSMDAIMHAKGELLDQMGPDKVAIVNADDPRCLQLAEKYTGEVLLVGTGVRADIRAANIEVDPGGTRFELIIGTTAVPVRLSVCGNMMVPNALTAAAVGHRLGLAPETIAAGLESIRSKPGRMDISELNGIHLIDDSYNANPASMQAALTSLQTLAGNHRKIAVLGEMAELGEASEHRHHQLGRRAARSGIALLCAAGTFARAVLAGAAEAGMPASAMVAGSRQEIADLLARQVVPGDWVLVKGSRIAAMEKIVAALKQHLNPLVELKSETVASKGAR